MSDDSSVGPSRRRVSRRDPTVNAGNDPNSTPVRENTERAAFLERAGRDRPPVSASATRAARGKERETRRSPALVRVPRGARDDRECVGSFRGDFYNEYHGIKVSD